MMNPERIAQFLASGPAIFKAVEPPEDYNFADIGNFPSYSDNSFSIPSYLFCAHAIIGTTIDWGEQPYPHWDKKRGEIEITFYRERQQSADAFKKYVESACLQEGGGSWSESRDSVFSFDNESLDNFQFQGVAIVENLVFFMRLYTPELNFQDAIPRGTQIRLFFERLKSNLSGWLLDPSLLVEAVRSAENLELDKVVQLGQRVLALVEPHLTTLVAKKRQLIITDAYGNQDIVAWVNELNYFAERMILGRIDLSASDKQRLIPALFYLVIDAECPNTAEELTHDNVDTMDPLAFEAFCCDLLRRDGWSARLTKATGDQGVDIFAEYQNLRLVLQCKKTSAPVGNSAVQEILGGKQYERAHVAAVVSNSPYTSSARQLASVADVFLLHYSELSSFSKRLGLIEEADSQ